MPNKDIYDEKGNLNNCSNCGKSIHLEDGDTIGLRLDTGDDSVGLSGGWDLLCSECTLKELKGEL